MEIWVEELIVIVKERVWLCDISYWLVVFSRRKLILVIRCLKLGVCLVEDLDRKIL